MFTVFVHFLFASVWIKGLHHLHHSKCSVLYEGFVADLLIRQCNELWLSQSKKSLSSSNKGAATHLTRRKSCSLSGTRWSNVLVCAGSCDSVDFLGCVSGIWYVYGNLSKSFNHFNVLNLNTFIIKAEHITLSPMMASFLQPQFQEGRWVKPKQKQNGWQSAGLSILN